MEHRRQPSNSIPIDVNFSCQRCCQPLRLDPTLNKITKEIVLDLISKNQPTTQLEKEKIDSVNESNKFSNSAEKNSGVFHKTIQSFRSTECCGFSLINNETTTANSNHFPSIASSLLSGFEQTLSSNLDKNNKDLKLQIQLFDILSDQSDIDHPLCEECADFVIEQMEKQLTILEKECADYEEYQKKIETSETETSDQEIESLKSKLEELKKNQIEKISELKKLNKEQKDLDKQLEQYEKELKQSKLEEEKYWHEYNTVKYNYFQCDEELNTLENKIRHAKDYCNKLKRTSIFNMVFSIGHNGPFGTINGYRLGRLPTYQVEWDEVNAAWGQCALLLASLSKKLNFSFQRYKIVPYGNSSFIESLDDKSKQLPLYTSGGLKYYFNHKFDQAMVAFLECLQQFYEEIQKQDEDFKLPYQIDVKGEIYEKSNSQNRYSIKININTEEKWTKALKFMLTNLKWALAWVASKHVD